MRTRNISFIILLLMLSGSIFAQQKTLYVGKACISDPDEIMQGQPGQDPQQAYSCDEPTYFFDTSKNPSGSWNWDFGDGLVSNQDVRNPSHNFHLPGPYTVTVTAETDGHLINRDSKVIHVGYYPLQPLFEGKTVADTTLCDGSTITLNPYDKGLGGLITGAPSNVDYNYKWFPNGETTPTIDVNKPGCYTVEVIDRLSGCSRFAKINVKVCMDESGSKGGSEQWFFGYGSGLDFSLKGVEITQDSLAEEGSLNPEIELGDPVFEGSAPPGNNMRAEAAAAVVLNSSGGVALYTDGKHIFSGEDDTEIPDLSGNPFIINGNSGAQGLALVPAPICSACNFIKYHLFSVDEATGILSYSVIDMRENDGKGAVVESGIPVGMDMKGKLIAERGNDDESYSITAFDGRENDFKILTIDSLGVHVPKILPLTKNFTKESKGYVTISTNGSLLAHGVLNQGSNHIEIYQRDPETGSLSNPKPIILGPSIGDEIYGMAFSPNGQFLYITLKGDGKNIKSKLIQFDLNTNIPEEIYSGIEELGALALGPKYGEGKKYIYVTVNNGTHIQYIQEPDEWGKDAVGFTMNSSLPGVSVSGTTKLGFPNVVAPPQEQEGDGIQANYSGNCMNAPTFFTVEEICNPFVNRFEWIIEGQKYSDKGFTHTFSKPGWHNINLTITIYEEEIEQAGIKVPIGKCREIDYEGRIYIKPAPSVDIPDPFYVCTDAPLYTKYTPIAEGGDNFTYNWMTSLDAPLQSDPDGTYEFKVASPYKLEVVNNFNCSTTYAFDTFKRCEPIVHIPEVFTPNGDGLNDTFDMEYHYITDPVLEIYNRWGEMVFRTEDLDQKWNGMYKGKVFGNQLYAYILRYFARDYPDMGAQRKTGSVLILGD